MKIEIDKASQDNLNRQFEALKVGAGRSMFSALMKVGFKIKTEAQLRLTGRGHIVTSRLKNSIFVKSKKMTDVLNSKNQLTYSDKDGKSYNSDLSTVSLNEGELAIGTNVEYAAAIEFGSRPHVIEVKNKKVLSNGTQIFGKRVNHPGFGGDSYLYWALRNVDVLSNVGKDMQDDIKFGRFVGKGVINDKSSKAMTS
jgi:phage gpG-like protein